MSTTFPALKVFFLWRSSWHHSGMQVLVDPPQTPRRRGCAMDNRRGTPLGHSVSIDVSGLFICEPHSHLLSACPSAVEDVILFKHIASSLRWYRLWIRSWWISTNGRPGEESHQTKLQQQRPCVAFSALYTFRLKDCYWYFIGRVCLLGVNSLSFRPVCSKINDGTKQERSTWRSA